VNIAQELELIKLKLARLAVRRIFSEFKHQGNTAEQKHLPGVNRT
jgi:hypothetical protein